ncbi:uncharacterized protein LOC113793558 isoform X2 [Dermatophagoides pteronyssinus]|uniref:uncharacterized protein LOC113793558 isoform X2 n=1 Tax=Dermatophagoides pteronyssinus TaxID=6956 RepID=UPI003F676815
MNYLMVNMAADNQMGLGQESFKKFLLRLSVVNFLYPHYIDQFTYATVPIHSDIELDVFIKPFDWIEWLMFFIAFFVFLIFDQLINIVEHRKFHDHFIWISLCIIFRQSYKLINRLNLSRKICAITWLFSVFVMHNVYSCQLYSILIIRNSYVIDTVNKLAEAAVQNLIIPVGLDSSVYQMLHNSGITAFDSIDEKSIKVARPSDGINLITQTSNRMKKSFMIKKQTHAFIASRITLEFAQLKFGENLIYVPPTTMEADFYPLFIVIPFGKAFDHREEFNIMISYLRSTGIINYWKSIEFSRTKYKVSYQNAINDESISEEQLSIEHYQSLFFLLEILILVSTIIFCLELLKKIINNKLMTDVQ